MFLRAVDAVGRFRPEDIALTSRIQLSAPSISEGFAALLMARRSVREYAEGSLTLEDVARLFWAGQGISHSSGKRTTPSSHGLNPLSLYLVAGAVTDVAAGLYAYEPRTNALDGIGHGDLRPKLYQAALEDQPWVRDCAALILITGDTQRIEREFAEQPPDGLRGRRYLHMEAGAAAQNIALQAVELQLGCVLVAGFDDEAVQRCLGVATDPLIMLPLGPTADSH
jgi:SagB-type dehydrogenase family enzyme